MGSRPDRNGEHLFHSAVSGRPISAPYRSAKPLLAPTLLAALFYVHDAVNRRLSTPSERPRFFTTSFLSVTGFGCALSLLDRQGFFYTVVLSASLIVVALWRRHCMDLLAGGFVATCLMTLYNLVIGPWIIHEVNGYWSTFQYQWVPMQALMAEPSRLTLQAIELLLQSARLLLGSFPIWVYAIAAAAFFAVGAYRSRDVLPRRHKGLLAVKPYVLRGLLISVAVGSQVVMFTLMILRHVPIYDWPDHRLWYYPLPYQALLLFGMAVLVGRLLRRDMRRVLAVNLVLIVVIIGNITSWRSHRDTLLQSPWFPTVYAQSAALKESLRDRRPAPDLNKSFRGFYEYCVRRMPK